MRRYKKGGEIMKGFLEFIRSQGVMGLAVGFILGGAVSKLVAALVTDIINPLLGLALNSINLNKNFIAIGKAKLLWGSLASDFINFLVVALVVYFGVKWLRLDKLDKKKDK